MEKYVNLINAMPLMEQAFSTKKATWEKYIHGDSDTPGILNSIFLTHDQVELSRADLFRYASSGDLKIFVIATILWGYPSGMRGNHFSNICAKLNDIVRFLERAQNGISDWNKHWKDVDKIHGLGLSTYSKLLYFLNVEVHGVKSLILDDRIVRTIRKQSFDDFDSLLTINNNNAPKKYPDYLNTIHALTKRYNVDGGKTEMFLFEFGLNLKRL